ncbi:hypothetical protein BB561_006326 [Smittium simulii]|uniref:Uncharacterized protein n=1 Tax=Smittium simulii TaxID=133385 RepID=A0A2T9Y549_9FUNG|nr:hypothetical protein BB561_006326 [Smittium simulii]
MLIRSVLLPMATYGGELFGMNNPCCAVMGCSSSTVLARMCNKLKIVTVNTKTAVAPLTLKTQKNNRSKIIAWIDQIMAGRIRSVGLLELVYPEYSQSIHSIIKMRTDCFKTIQSLFKPKYRARASTIETQFPNFKLLVISSTRTRLLGTPIEGNVFISIDGVFK